MLVLPDDYENEAIAESLGPDILRVIDVDFDFGGKKSNLSSSDHCEEKVVYWAKSYTAIKFSISGGFTSQSRPIETLTTLEPRPTLVRRLPFSIRMKPTLSLDWTQIRRKSKLQETKPIRSTNTVSRIVRFRMWRRTIPSSHSFLTQLLMPFGTSARLRPNLTQFAVVVPRTNSR